MDIKEIKKLIKNHSGKHRKFIETAEIADRYYRNKNDILKNKKKDDTENPLRNADNRISSNFHGLLANQKSSYLFTAPPLFDVGNTNANDIIAEILGDKYAKVCKDLCINASNCGIAWLHIWKNEDNEFEYGVVDSKQIISIWSSELNRKILAVLRTYKNTDDKGNVFDIYEYWTDKECLSFKKKSSDSTDEIIIYNSFSTIDCDTGINTESNILKHEFGEVPFIPFFNNNLKTSDLDNIKPLIDVYDKVFSGFVDDLEDIQEIIFLLTNYGENNLDTFLKDLKKYKTVKLDSDGANDKSGLSILTIDIPVEAREKLINMTRKSIFEQGQGVDPDPQNFGNSSGVALKYLYSLLELKAGLMETEFKLGFGKLVRMICRYKGIKIKSIIQTWTRTAISNDAELVEMTAKSEGVISKKSILKNHPFVENADLEEIQIKKEEQNSEDIYNKISLNNLKE